MKGSVLCLVCCTQKGLIVRIDTTDVQDLDL